MDGWMDGGDLYTYRLSVSFLSCLRSRVCTWCLGYRVMIDERAYVYANMIDVRLDCINLLYLSRCMRHAQEEYKGSKSFPKFTKTR